MRLGDARSQRGAPRPVRDLALLLFVAAALVAGLIHFSLARDEERATVAAPPSSSVATPSPAPPPPPPSSSSTSGGSVTTTPSSTTAVDVAAVTCWNGVPAARLAPGSRPSGVAGLRWVFPTLGAAGTSCHQAPRAAGDYATVAARECFARVAGEPISITFEQVASTREAAAAIDWAYPQGEQYLIKGARGGRCTWFDRTGRPARATGYYEGYPYVVSLVAARPGVARQAWASLVGFRAPGSMRGVRS